VSQIEPDNLIAARVGASSLDLPRVTDAPTPAAPVARGRVLVVDDIDANRALVTALLTRDGYDVSVAGSGREALDSVRRDRPDLILLDVMMPGLNGFDVCGALKQDPATRLIPIVLVTALHHSEDRIRSIEAGADDFISKPFNAHELRARVQSLIRIKRYTDDLDSAESVIISLALTIEARDRYTEGHCQRLSSYASDFGRHLGFGEDDVTALVRGGFLHDIGKVGIPDAILLKPGRLTPEEYRVMQQHAAIGDRLCGELRSLRRVRPIVRHHHERLDGSGYPDGLRGDAIPLLAQLMGIVDVFDALTTARPYKPALSIPAAAQELAWEADRGWHRRDLVDTFIQLVGEGHLPRRDADRAETRTA
jgi:putative two-component system response regulator